MREEERRSRRGGVGTRVRGDGRVRLVALRRRDGHVDGALRPAVHQRVRHVVPVADVRELERGQLPELLAHREVVRQRLARVEEIRQAVDDGDRRVTGELEDRVVRERAGHDAVHVAREDAGRVRDRLAAPELDVARRQELCGPPELRHARLERDAGPRGRLLEDHREDLPGERRPELRRARFHPGGEGEEGRDVGGGQVVDRDEVLLEHGLPFYTGSRTSGIVMQRGPPRARDSSGAESRIACLPGFLRSSVSLPSRRSSSATTAYPSRARESAGALVPVVAEDDAGREREHVRAVRPLLALLVDRIGAAAEDGNEVDAQRRERREQVVPRGPRDLARREVGLVHVRLLGAAREDHRPVAETLAGRDAREHRVEVHRRALRRNRHDEDLPDPRPLPLEGLGEALDRRLLRALRVADDEHLRRKHEDVASFERGPHARPREVAPFARGELLEPEARPLPGEPRVPGEDRPGQQRLAPASAGRHRAPDDAVAHDRCGIALEEPVRERRQQVEGIEGAGDGGLGALDPLHEARREPAGGKLVQREKDCGRPCEQPRELREHLVARVGIAQDLLEELLNVEHLVRHEAEHLPEPPVLLARAGPEQDVVEEQVLHHRGHHPVDLATGLVDEDRAQAPESRSRRKESWRISKGRLGPPPEC